MKTADYLDAIKARHGLPSDYAASKLLGVTRSAVSRYRNGQDSFSDDVAIRAADLLDIDPGELLIQSHLERATDERQRAAWMAALQRHAGHAAGVFFSVAVILCLSTYAESDMASGLLLPVTVFRSETACTIGAVSIACAYLLTLFLGFVRIRRLPLQG